MEKKQNASSRRRALPFRTSSLMLGFLLVFSPLSAIAGDAEKSAESAVASEQKTITVKGTVIDEAGNPLVGVTVFSTAVNKGVVTDFDGKFEIRVAEGSKLTVSLMGFLDETITAGTGNLTVVLKEDVVQLDATVVLGYGSTLKKNLTGAVASISGETVLTTKATNVSSSLAGKVAGVNIRQKSGQPGSNDVDFSVRGFGQPLFVIDGVLRSNSDDFSRLNPDDIENISVLKDATAAVYGIGSGNGVVIVTTKKGTKQRTSVSYSGVYGITAPTGIPEMCNAAEWVTLKNESEVNAGRNPWCTPEEYEKWQTGAPGYESTDWVAAVLKKTASQHQHMLSVNGGNDRATYYVSFGYLNETGLLKNADDISYNQYNFRSNLNFKFTDNLIADVNISGRFADNNSTAYDYATIMSQATQIPPIYKIYANDNPDYLNDVLPSNPVAYASSEKAGYAKTTSAGIQTTTSLTWNVPFVQGLSAKVLFAYDWGNSHGKAVNKGYNVYSYSAQNDTYTTVPKGKPANISQSGSYSTLMNSQWSINYKNSFGKHNVEAGVVWETFDRTGDWYGLSREYKIYTNDTIDQANDINSKDNSGTDAQYRNLSLITRAHYDYKGKYLIDFASRYDGSWRYAPGHRWGFFPSVSAGWRVSEEPFIKDNIGHILTNFKIRASYGQAGEDAGNAFQWISAYTVGTGSGYIFKPGETTPGTSSPILVNDDLTWLRINTADIGFDATLWDGLLGIEFDWYQRDRTGLLAYRNTSVPWYFGQDLPQENLNSDRVMGLDLTLSTRKRWGDFVFGARLIMNYARSMRMYIEQQPYNNAFRNFWSNNAYRMQGYASTYKVIGRFQNMEEIYHAVIHDPSYGGTKYVLPGDFIYDDTDGDGIITNYDKRDNGFWNSTPKFNYGLNLDFAWKNFDVNILLNGAAMYSLKYDGLYTTMLGIEGAHNAPKYMLDRWHRADIYDPDSEWIPGNWPAMRKSSDVHSVYNDSDFWRKKGDYLRLKSLEIGYTIPDSVLRKVKIQKARIYVNGYNLFTICDPFLKPFDPEKGDGGYTYSYPLSRLFNFGVNITF